MTTVPGDNVKARSNVLTNAIERGDILTDTDNIRKPCINFTAIVNLTNLQNNWKLKIGFEVSCHFIKSKRKCKIVKIINKCILNDSNEELDCLQNNDSALSNQFLFYHILSKR